MSEQQTCNNNFEKDRDKTIFCPHCKKSIILHGDDTWEKGE